MDWPSEIIVAMWRRPKRRTPRITFGIRVGPIEVVSILVARPYMLVAVADPSVAREVYFAVALRRVLIAEVAGHGHAIPGTERRPEHFVEMSRKAMTPSTQNLLLILSPSTGDMLRG